MKSKNMIQSYASLCLKSWASLDSWYRYSRKVWWNDLDKITTAITTEALVHSPSFAVAWGVQTGIGSLPLVWFGTDEQKEKFFPK
ncbi:MAG: hypothetical protein Ct9H300mP18_08570 [Candidatus Neomarinimicrobiota bacterium]|nr:MAG: hypothetical protein Ct9H300mP18_08570 [Candidatus Neomarinimicrobiota bacterium]